MCVPRVTRHISIDIQVLVTHASTWVHRTSLVVKQLFSFPVAVKNSIKVDPLVLLL
jgi:hypothetical protein